MIMIKSCTKRYGKNNAISNLNLNLENKEIYCLLGRNGAGKTTLLKMLSGFIDASEGEILIDGKKVGTMLMPKSLTFIEERSEQFNFSIKDLIKTAKTFNENFDIEFAYQMLKKFKLDEKKKFKQLSFGMKTMVTTIISLASNSQIVVLDEPALGLDAIMRCNFYELLLESFEKNPRTIIVSTHLIDEISKIIKKIIIIDEGKLVLFDDVNNVNEKVYFVTGHIKDVEIATQGLNIISEKKLGKFLTRFVYDKRIALNDDIEIGNLSLQELFVNLVGGKEDEKRN